MWAKQAKLCLVTYAGGPVSLHGSSFRLTDARSQAAAKGAKRQLKKLLRDVSALPLSPW